MLTDGPNIGCANAHPAHPAPPPLEPITCSADGGECTAAGLTCDLTNTNCVGK